MINNAGIMPHSLLEQARIDDWNRMIDINLKGVLYGISAALEPMKRQKAGHIINVSSVAGHKVRPGSAVYAATKAAVLMLSEACGRRSSRIISAPPFSPPVPCSPNCRRASRTRTWQKP
ncbi:SDR family oxidoreductase [Acetobacter papayae]|uniref:SDR family oxidoreductase n=1 Tax=Acetobacter papayae TaxID=1076592 RepID=UPI00046E9DB6